MNNTTDLTKHFVLISQESKPAPEPPSTIPGPLSDLIWQAKEGQRAMDRQVSAYFMLSVGATEKAGLPPLAIHSSVQNFAIAFSRYWGLPGETEDEPIVTEPSAYMLVVAFNHGISFNKVMPGAVPETLKPWLNWIAEAMEGGCVAYDAGFGLAADDKAPSRVKEAIESLLAEDSPEDPGTETRKRGRTIQLPRDDIYMPRCESWRTATAGLMNINKGKFDSVLGYVVKNPAGATLDFRLDSESQAVEGQRITFQQCAEQLVSFVDVLSLKLLLGSVYAWAENTGHSRYDQDSEMLSFNQIMRCSGLEGNPNDELRNSYVQSFLPLIRSWVEVPRYEPLRGRPPRQGTKPIRDGVHYERVLCADKIQLAPAMFADNPDFSKFDIWSVRYHPGEWLYNALFGKGKQFTDAPFQLLRYSAKRQPWHIKIGFHLCPLLGISKRYRNEEQTYTAESIMRGAGLTIKKGDIGAAVTQLNRTCDDLIKDGVINGVEVKYQDIGANYPAKERLAKWRLQIVF